MAITITDHLMSSPDTPHTAAPSAGAGWYVTWLPGRLLTRTLAIAAMTIAAVVGGRELPSGDQLWPHLEGWAAELGLSAVTAVVWASEPPRYCPHQDPPPCPRCGLPSMAWTGSDGPHGADRWRCTQCGQGHTTPGPSGWREVRA